MPSGAQDSQVWWDWSESGQHIETLQWQLSGIHQGQRQPPWWYNKPMLDRWKVVIRIARLVPMVFNGIQWSYRLTSRDWYLASFLQAEAPGRIRSNFSLQEQSLSSIRVCQGLCQSMLPWSSHSSLSCWANAAIYRNVMALKSWGPGSRKYSSGKFGMRLLT